MNNVIDIIKQFLIAEKYKITNTTDCKDHIKVRYELNTILILPSSKENFITVLLPGIDSFDDETELSMLRICNKFNSLQKVVKAFSPDQKLIALTYEFYYADDNDLLYQIRKSFSALIVSKVHFSKLTKENK